MWQCGSVAVLQCGSVAVLQCDSVAVWQSGSAVGTPGPVFENVVKGARLPAGGLRHNLKELPLHLSQVFKRKNITKTQ